MCGVCFQRILQVLQCHCSTFSLFERISRFAFVHIFVYSETSVIYMIIRRKFHLALISRYYTLSLVNCNQFVALAFIPIVSVKYEDWSTFIKIAFNFVFCIV